jgi:hypothetical protein
MWRYKMLNKPFDDIEKDIIDALIAEQVSETKQLEYKKELPSGTEKEKVVRLRMPLVGILSTAWGTRKIQMVRILEFQNTWD